MFSLGIAVVLVALGLVVCKATDFANRYLETPELIMLASISSPVLIVGMGVVLLWQTLAL